MTSEADTTIKKLVNDLNKEQRYVLCTIINQLSDGVGHPMATESTLPFFETDFVRPLVDRSLNAMTDKGVAVVRQIRAISGWDADDAE